MCLLSTLTSCFTTQVITNNEKARVFLDGEYQGTGSNVSIPSGGRFAEVEIKAEAGGKTTKQRMNRKFTFTTLIGSLYTYGIGLFFFWQLPDVIYMHIPNGDNTQDDPWTSPKDDPWMK